MGWLLKYLFVYFTVSKLHSVRQLHFRKMDLDCIIKDTVIGIIAEISIINCAYKCKSSSNPCSRFSWDPVSRKCVLSSNKYDEGIAFSISSNFKSYTIMQQECPAVDYDYDFETNTCLRLMKLDNITWYDARSRCQQDGGDLITITTKEKYDFAINYIKCDIKAWIGIEDHVWVSGTPYQNVFGVTSSLNGFDNDFPNDNGPFCGAMQIFNPAIYDMSCRYCTIIPTFLCEINMPNNTNY